MNSIEINNINKYYAASKNNFLTFKANLTGMRKSEENGFTAALKDVSLTVEKGECVGIIGGNGSGKSTLLKIAAGITAPDSGTVAVHGRVAALIELGAGFNPEYTGRENIYLSGAMSGAPRSETAKTIGGIIDFSELGEYIDMPVKTYSSGMLVRLAFAAAVDSEPDVLLVDEALAVGDYRFQAKCFRRLEELKRKGVTIIFVTHDLDAARRFCERCVWLEKGRIVIDGATNKVTAEYIEHELSGTGIDDETRDKGTLNRFGSGVGAIVSVIPDRAGYLPNETITVDMALNIPESAPLDKLAASLAVKDRTGLDLFVMSDAEYLAPGGKFRGSGLLSPGANRIRFKFKNVLNSGKYFIAAGLEIRGEYPIKYIDYAENIAEFESVGEIGRERYGLITVDAKVEALKDGDAVDSEGYAGDRKPETF